MDADTNGSKSACRVEIPNIEKGVAASKKNEEIAEFLEQRKGRRLNEREKSFVIPRDLQPDMSHLQ